MTVLLQIIAFITAHAGTISETIHFVVEAEQKFQANADKKAWVKEQLVHVKSLTPDSVDRIIDAVVDLLTILKVLPE